MRKTKAAKEPRIMASGEETWPAPLIAAAEVEVEAAEEVVLDLAEEEVLEAEVAGRVGVSLQFTGFLGSGRRGETDKCQLSYLCCLNQWMKIRW